MSKFNLGMKTWAVFFLSAGAAVALPAQTTSVAPAVTFTTLHSFIGPDGMNPSAALVQATDGKLYGSTGGGGAHGHGTVFTITPAGLLTTFHSFGGVEGSGPSGVIQGVDGNFYGTAASGGANSRGTVYKVSPSGTLTVLYTFCLQLPCSDGQHPFAGLAQASDGNFYGTTALGGMGGCGTVFKITTTGTLTTLHRFDFSDGCGPTGLIQGRDGTFYGTTGSGGAFQCAGAGCGTVFKITPSGALTTLHCFDGTDGIGPLAAVVQGVDGNFYGTTYLGGKTVGSCESSGCGTIFKITSDGNFTNLYKFGGTDGLYPEAALIQATDGNFYGTTFGGGANDFGTVFTITPSGALTTLHSFDDTDGRQPLAALVQDTNGVFYGTNSFGGGNTCNGGSGCGTVFSLSVGLGPFVEAQPTSRNVGAGVKILGNNLTGATSVTFNGIPATFSVPRNTLIRATVPAGATTGPVQVVTPKGTLTSNVPFRVQQ